MRVVVRRSFQVHRDVRRSRVWIRSCRWNTWKPSLATPVSAEKHNSGEEDTWEDKLAEHQIRGWMAVSDGSQSKGSRERSRISQSPVCTRQRRRPRRARTRTLKDLLAMTRPSEYPSNLLSSFAGLPKTHLIRLRFAGIRKPCMRLC